MCKEGVTAHDQGYGARTGNLTAVGPLALAPSLAAEVNRPVVRSTMPTPIPRAVWYCPKARSWSSAKTKNEVPSGRRWRAVVAGMANAADGLRHNFTSLPAVDFAGVVATPLAGGVERAPAEGAPARCVVLLEAQAASSNRTTAVPTLVRDLFIQLAIPFGR